MDVLEIEANFFYQQLEEEILEHQHLKLVPPFGHERHECSRTDQFIRAQVQWHPINGRTVILEPI